jgi:uncharacterized protein
LAALGPAQPAPVAPSFSCSAASLPAEVTICGDAELAGLDDQLASQFSGLLAARPAAAAAAIRAEQARWMQRRDACGSNKECIADSYRGRLQQLTQLSVDGGAAPVPSFNCRAASLPAEIAICADAELAGLDNRLASQFSASLGGRSAGSAAAISAGQLRWLQDRNACGANRDCIANSYRARLQQLTQLGVGAEVASAGGPSFNCRAASLPAEVAICADAELSSLDSQLASQFSASLAGSSAGSAATISAEQLRWLQQRNACGSNQGCIANSYRARLQRLTQHYQ